MKFLSKEALNRVLFLLISALLLFVPIIFSTNTNELYEFPKMFFVYFVGVTVLFVFVAYVVLYDGKTLWPNKKIYLLVLSFVVSTIFSTHLYTSLWGYYTRFNGGLISVLIFFGLFIVFINILQKKDVNLLLSLILFGSLPINIYAVMQYFFTGELRVYSTFGQPNWLAAYMVMLFPLMLHKLFNTTGFKIFWIFAVFCCFSAIWLTFSMSGILGLVGVVIFYLVLNRRLVLEKKLLAVVVFVICLVFAISTSGFFALRAKDVLLDVKKFISSQVNVYAQDTYKVSDPGFIRKGMWEGTLRLIVSSPKVFLIGTGPETFPYAFQPFRPKILNYSSEWDFILNKPHNYYLELFSQNGVLGLLGYLGIIIWSLKLKHKFITPALFGFYITNIFGWPTVATTLLFWFFISVLVIYEREHAN